MNTKKKAADHTTKAKKKEHERSPLVTETNPEGAQYDNNGPNSDGPKGNLVDGESTNDGRDDQ